MTKLYINFNETYDGLTMMSASLYPQYIVLNVLDEVVEDFHRVYVMLNYKYLLDYVIKNEFSSYIESIDDDENCRNFTLEFEIDDAVKGIEDYIKRKMNKINEHPDKLLKNIDYQEAVVRDDVFELYLNAARKLILDIEWLNK